MLSVYPGGEPRVQAKTEDHLMATTTYTQANQPISVNVPSLGTDVLLLETFAGTEAVSELFRFDLNVLTLLASNTATGLAFDSLLGQSISVALQPATLTVRNFNGIISKITEGHRILGSTGSLFLRYQIEMVPSAWLLTRVKRSRIFQQKSVTDILTAVLGSNGVSNQIKEPLSRALLRAVPRERLGFRLPAHGRRRYFLLLQPYRQQPHARPCQHRTEQPDDTKGPPA